ncbi:hypothetical protein O3U67_15765 [Brevundimonas diminuta]|uniref:hypothetical protein n=1 Tax=Brevundimonas diminuta TaxID=293 RepID=UPI0022AE688B|nr:hypothetical protein [Brevundimonas diminuta]MCZ4109547.1 hypothetical protein [Brevundimonas diminuta]
MTATGSAAERMWIASNDEAARLVDHALAHGVVVGLDRRVVGPKNEDMVITLTVRRSGEQAAKTEQAARERAADDMLQQADRLIDKAVELEGEAQRLRHPVRVEPVFAIRGAFITGDLIKRSTIR